MNECFPLTFENHKNILPKVSELKDKIVVQDFTSLFHHLQRRMLEHI